MNHHFKCPRGKDEKMHKCDDIMNRHLICSRGKNEKMLKCDDESSFKMSARKK